MEDEDYDLIAENTGIQLQRKKFRRIHGNVLDSDEEGEEEIGAARPQAVSREDSSGGRGTGLNRQESRESALQDDDFAHVSGVLVGIRAYMNNPQNYFCVYIADSKK